MAKLSKTRRNIIIIAAITVIVAAPLLAFGILKLIENRESLETEKTPGGISVELGEAERKKWPIIDHLPLKNALFTIGYTIDEENNLKIYVDSTNTDIEAALKKLASLSSEPLKSYDIEIRSPKNPFENQFVENSAMTPSDFLKNGYPGIDFAITSIDQDGETYAAHLTTGSEEAFNLVHYTAIIKNDGGLKLTLAPTISILLDQ